MKKTILLLAAITALVGCSKKETPSPKFDLKVNYTATWGEVYNWDVNFPIENLDNFNFTIDYKPFVITSQKGDTISLSSKIDPNTYVLFNGNYGIKIKGTDTIKIYNYALD